MAAAGNRFVANLRAARRITAAFIQGLPLFGRDRAIDRAHGLRERSISICCPTRISKICSADLDTLLAAGRGIGQRAAPRWPISPSSLRSEIETPASRSAFPTKKPFSSSLRRKRKARSGTRSLFPFLSRRIVGVPSPRYPSLITTCRGATKLSPLCSKEDPSKHEIKEGAQNCATPGNGAPASTWRLTRARHTLVLVFGSLSSSSFAK